MVVITNVSNLETVRTVETAIRLALLPSLMQQEDVAEAGSRTGDDPGSRPDGGPVRVRTAAELDEQLAAGGTVLVELFTEGCGICASEAPVLSGVARTTDARVVTCNPRDDPVLVDRFDVRSVPTFLVFDDGDLVARRSDGFQSVSDLTELLAAATERSSESGRQV
jgi:thiol-disulfide isomerase/thioredoxin